MQVIPQPNLAQLTTFSVAQSAQQLIIIESIEDLQQLKLGDIDPFYVLGEGSNTLFINDYEGTVILPKLMGLEFIEDKDAYLVKSGAGENWHHLVKTCLDNGIYGLENLALIPGSVGAAPIQNIGAYGCEFADHFQSLLWYEFSSQKIHKLAKEECLFGYRDSIFKRALKGKGIVVEVTLEIPKVWQPQLNYSGLSELALSQNEVTAQTIFEHVIKIRSAKLPDPKILANAGSFFKNPVVPITVFNKLKATYPDMPSYLVTDTQVKLAAGWLIDQAGLKGFKEGSVGVHKNQALVIVNYGEASGHKIWQLAQYIQDKVESLFGISLEPEVRLIDSSGEMN